MPIDQSKFATKEDLAAEFDINPKTLTRRLKACGFPVSRKRLSPADQDAIRELLGFPKFYDNAGGGGRNTDRLTDFLGVPKCPEMSDLGIGGARYLCC